MKYRKIIPMVTFIIGGGIGFKCGTKIVLHARKRYMESGEFKKNMEKILKIHLDKYAWE